MPIKTLLIFDTLKTYKRKMKREDPLIKTSYFGVLYQTTSVA